MRRAVEYELPGGSTGFCLFSAKDLHAAQTCVAEMRTHYGHHDVFNLSELANGTGIEELYRLFRNGGKASHVDPVSLSVAFVPP